MKIVAFAGGVGGAKLVDGLAGCVSPEDLTIVINTGDDFVHYGLNICPDLDTVIYTLAGLANPETGWGRKGETWRALETVKDLGGPSWFQLGDSDIGLHMERTRRLKDGDSLTSVTKDFCRYLKIEVPVLPMTDDHVATYVSTKEMGELPFQEYFVKFKCLPVVTGFRFDGIETARPSREVVEAIYNADLIIFCPSNPWVSIGPILALDGVKDAIKQCTVVAVSPIIGGKALKGPAAKMYQEMGIEPSALAVCKHYHNLLSAFILDDVDSAFVDIIRQWGIIPYRTNTIMLTLEDRKRLACEILSFCEKILENNIIHGSVGDCSS